MPTLTRILLLFFLAWATVGVSGCSCRQETPQERAAREKREEEARLKKLEEAKKNKKKPPIETKLLQPQPNQPDQPLPIVKPGHWMTATQATKANYQDWVGVAQQQITDRQGQPTPIERTAFTLRTSRDAAVAKGQEKALETVLFTPNSFKAARLRTSLLDRSGGYAEPPSLLGVTRLLPHQYHFLVLAAEPERYGFLRNGCYAIDAPIAWNVDIATPSGGGLPPRRNYRVVAPPVDKPLILADNPLCWTTTAYVLWDEVDPQRLTPEQQRAMIDWLHWGGQLIVSGPDSLDLLKESFLAPYLPADGAGPRTITREDLAGFVAAYQVSSRGREPLADDLRWSGVKLKLRPQAEPVPEARDLFAERRVGRGRVIVSSPQLAERGLLNWSGGFENLFNALVLRRPPRRFSQSNVSFDGTETPLYVRQVKSDLPLLDATANTRLRFFARDTHTSDTPFRYRLATASDRGGDFGDTLGGLTINDLANSRTLVPGGKAGGVAAWSDFNAAANAAREALREAAGVKVPRRSFVLGCLAVYLAVIGPVNWFFFKALGRVELAWVAAPIITAIGTVAVVRLAELDIGFARAQTEIAVLETQPGHNRGHLTRYTAVYTSLATTYEFASDEPSTLIAPFPRSPDFELLRGQSPTEVTFERQDKVRLRGFTVSSAATDMAHTEQMVALPQGLRYDAAAKRIVNNTGFDLASLAIVRREEGRGGEPSLVGCWIGSLPNERSTTVTFAPILASEEEPAFVQERIAEAELLAEERLNLEPLFRLALNVERLDAGEVRAVARVDTVLPGLDVTPRAAQSAGATLLVAHLDYAPLPPPKSDVNAPIDVAAR